MDPIHPSSSAGSQTDTAHVANKKIAHLRAARPRGRSRARPRCGRAGRTRAARPGAQRSAARAQQRAQHRRAQQQPHRIRAVEWCARGVRTVAAAVRWRWRAAGAGVGAPSASRGARGGARRGVRVALLPHHRLAAPAQPAPRAHWCPGGGSGAGWGSRSVAHVTASSVSPHTQHVRTHAPWCSDSVGTTLTRAPARGLSPSNVRRQAAVDVCVSHNLTPQGRNCKTVKLCAGSPPTWNANALTPQHAPTSPARCAAAAIAPGCLGSDHEGSPLPAPPPPTPPSSALSTCGLSDARCASGSAREWARSAAACSIPASKHTEPRVCLRALCGSGRVDGSACAGARWARVVHVVAKWVTPAVTHWVEKSTRLTPDRSTHRACRPPALRAQTTTWMRTE
jgi:hypothetical protein